MEVVKEGKEYTIYKKRSGRYAVKTKDGNYLNGVEKVKVLNKEGIVKGGIPKAKPKEEPKEEAPAEETPAEES